MLYNYYAELIGLSAKPVMKEQGEKKMTLIITYFLNIIRIIFDTLALYLDIRDIDNKRLKNIAKAGTLLISIIIYVALPLTNIDITNII